MSSKTKRMAQVMPKPEEPTKTVLVRFDLSVDIEDVGERQKSIYMHITGIPEDLPKEFEQSIILNARGQFVGALGSKLFLDFYDLGKGYKDQEPLYINIAKIKSIQIIKTEIVQ